MTGLLGAVIAPSTPLLLPGTGGRQGDEVVAEVLARAIAEISTLQRLSPATWVVVGGVAAAETDAAHDDLGADAIASTSAAIAPWPGRSADAPAKPLSLTVGRHLLSAAGIDTSVQFVGIAVDAAPQACLDLGASIGTSGTALLIIGDGAARRTRQSPGDHDERAEPFDDVIEKALADGDPAALAALDPALADELLVGGRAALQVLAGAFGESRPDVAPAGLLATAPLGLRYWVTGWT